MPDGKPICFAYGRRPRSVARARAAGSVPMPGARLRSHPADEKATTTPATGGTLQRISDDAGGSPTAGVSSEGAPASPLEGRAGGTGLLTVASPPWDRGSLNAVPSTISALLGGGRQGCRIQDHRCGHLRFRLRHQEQCRRQERLRRYRRRRHLRLRERRQEQCPRQERMRGHRGPRRRRCEHLCLWHRRQERMRRHRG